MTRECLDSRRTFSAHRGAADLAPENTLPALERAVAAGVRVIEIDVRTSLDGVLYDLHDATVDRTTNGRGLLRWLRSKRVDQLDAGAWFSPEFAETRVPRVDDIVRIFRNRVCFYFDVKPGVPLRKIVTLVRKHGIEARCMFWFKNPIAARRFKRRYPHLLLKMNAGNAGDIGDRVRAYKADVIECSADNFEVAMVEECRRFNVLLMVSFHGVESKMRGHGAFDSADILNVHNVGYIMSHSEHLQGRRG